MIVRKQSDGSVVMITQNDHAKLSGLFAAHWGNDTFAQPRPRAAMLRAAQYHDGGWLRYETDPTLDSQAGTSPSYFQVPNDAAQLAAYQWAIDMVTEVDAYSGLMVSKHRTGLWQSRYGTITQPAAGSRRALTDDIRRFIAANEARQQAIAATLDAGEVAINYRLLQVWDLLSLYICSHDQHRDETIAPAPTGYGDRASVDLRLKPTAAGTIAIDPYPFDAAPLAAGLVQRRLPATALHDLESFKAGYFGACPEVATFNFVPAA